MKIKQKIGIIHYEIIVSNMINIIVFSSYTDWSYRLKYTISLLWLRCLLSNKTWCWYPNIRHFCHHFCTNSNKTYMSFRPIKRRNEVMAGISKSFLTKPRRCTHYGWIATLKIIYTKSCYFLDEVHYGIWNIIPHY